MAERERSIRAIVKRDDEKPRIRGHVQSRHLPAREEETLFRPNGLPFRQGGLFPPGLNSGDITVLKDTARGEYARHLREMGSAIIPDSVEERDHSIRFKMKMKSFGLRVVGVIMAKDRKTVLSVFPKRAAGQSFFVREGEKVKKEPKDRR